VFVASVEIMQMQPQTGRESVSEGLLFNSAIYQLYHGQIKFIFNENDVYVRVEPKNINLVFVASVKHTALRVSKDWLAQNQANMSE
jgi:hypothetical protein